MGIWTKYTGAFTQALIVKESVSGVSTGYGLYQVGTNIYAYRQATGGSTGYRRWAIPTSYDGNWHLILFVGSGSDQTIYVDGVEGSSASGGPGIGLGSGGRLLVGSLSGGAPYNGWGCHSFVYNRELTHGEILAIYGDGTPQDLSVVLSGGLVHWSGLGDGDGAGTGTVLDKSGLGNHGTTTNITAPDFELDAPITPTGHDGTISSTSLMEYQPYYPPGCHLFNEQIIDGVARASHHFENSRSFMISYWIKTTSEIGTVFLSGSEREFAGFATYLEGGYPQYCMNDLIEWSRSVTYGYTIRSKKRVDDGAWHHVVIGQYQKAGATIWVDGVDEGKWTLVSALINSVGTTGDLLIGGHRENYGPINGVKGKLTEVSIWSGYLGQDGVDALYNSGSPPDLESLSFAKRLHGYWRMGASPGNPGVPVNIVATDERKRGDVPGEEAWSTRALDFDGSNDNLTIGNHFAFEWTTPFSVSFWSKCDDAERIMALTKSYGVQGWGIKNYYTVHFEVRSTVSGDGWLYMQTDDRKLFMGQEWYHVCVTYDGLGLPSGVHIYVDGYSERLDTYAFNAFEPTVSAINGSSLTFGRSSTTAYEDGVLDEVSFWDKELTEAEALELYNDGVPADLEAHSAYDDIAAWWRMGEATANGIMIDMEAEDIVLDAPTVQAGGGSNFTARALADDEIAGDMYGGATVEAETRALVTVAAAVAGTADVGTQTIVRLPGVSPPPVTEDLVPPEIRYVGLQPGREPQPPANRMSVATDPDQIQRQNREATRRAPTIIRKDTGTSSVPIKK